ncbi:hypothetical protein [Leptolyngbya sp. Heron Island J]|uniref:hypothetical protein n=1 Tax=Leptolyngbya sp. Heron Island J TaxID=1385935 RepID=UPI00041B8687|nr:hypothetical protein [Leptolyngbya sp. Heron Island J]
MNRLPALGGLGGLVFLSAVLHGALLLLPLPQWSSTLVEPEPEEAIEQSGAIAITTLPVVVPPVTQLEPETTPPPAPTSEVIEPPPLTQVPDNLPDIDEFIVEEPLDELDDIDDIEQPPFAPSDDENELDPQDSEPEAGIAVQFSHNFPHIPGAQAGCYGLQNCRIAEGQNYIDASRTIIDELTAQGYELQLYEGNDDSDVRNHRIYEMRSSTNTEAEVKYLNLFGEGLKTVIYLVTPRLITQAELQTLEINQQQTGG